MSPTARTEPHIAGNVVIRTLERLDEQTAAGELYRRVFDYSHDGSSVSPRLLRSLIDNGGSALGAFDRDDRLVGFAYGFSAVDGNATDDSAVDGTASFHYSQATVIDRAAQGLGIGRALKLEQARVALSTGAAVMRWSYDPYLVANAHFNLSSLGASGRWFHPDYYDEPHTDRLVVEWLLEPAARQAHRDRVDAARATVADDIRGAVGTATGSALTDHGGARWIAFDLDESGASAAPAARAALRDTIVGATAEGLAALACDTVEFCASGRPGPRRAAYVFGRL